MVSRWEWLICRAANKLPKEIARKIELEKIILAQIKDQIEESKDYFFGSSIEKDPKLTVEERFQLSIILDDMEENNEE